MVLNAILKFKPHYAIAKVYGLPTLILFKDGVEIPGSKWEGAITKAKIITWLEKNGVVPAQ